MLVLLVYVGHNLWPLNSSNLNLVFAKYGVSSSGEFFQLWMHYIDKLKQSWLNGWRGTDQSIIDKAFELTSGVYALKHVGEQIVDTFSNY